MFNQEMTVDRQQFLLWVLREHGPRVYELVERLLERYPPGHLTDMGAVLREALIQASPADYEFRPATDTLPYGFCSD